MRRCAEQGLTRRHGFPSPTNANADPKAGVATSQRTPKRPRLTDSGRLDLISLHALLTLHRHERDALAFLERLEAGTLDRAEVDEEIRARFRGDEAEALGIVEPLDGSGLTIRHFFVPLQHERLRHCRSEVTELRGGRKEFDGAERSEPPRHS